MSNVTIRSADVRDRPGLEVCFRELQTFERTIEPNRAAPELITRQYVDDLFAWCAKFAGRILIAEVEGEIAGFVSVLARIPSEDLIEQDPEFAEVTDLIVRESHREQGIGGSLLNAAEAFAVGQGATRLRIGVLAANAAAHRLYERQGFKPSEIILEKGLSRD
jgi:GNAT superfamily N-acetyltransferase